MPLLKIRLNLRFLALLHPLGEGAEVRSRDLHRLELARDGVKNALLDDICLEGPARMAQRVASGVAESGSLAGFDASACHGTAKISEP